MVKVIQAFKLFSYKTRPLILSAFLLLLSGDRVFGVDRFIVLASTTSTVNSGLFDIILPSFTRKTGISVRVIGVGTGQAIKIAQRGDADVLFVHHKKSELAFVEKGFGIKRHDVMFNDFVLVGPNTDPAGVRNAKSVVAAYQKIAASNSIFVSRGDDSGTHKKSVEIWRRASVEINNFSGRWYREVGSGMGATLNISLAMNGYTISDRATWEAFENKGSTRLLFEGDPSLRNQYGIIMVNPSVHRSVKAPLASAFINWVISNDGQKAINDFRVNLKQVFFANANSGGN